MSQYCLYRMDDQSIGIRELTKKVDFGRNDVDVLTVLPPEEILLELESQGVAKRLPTRDELEALILEAEARSFQKELWGAQCALLLESARGDFRMGLITLALLVIGVFV